VTTREEGVGEDDGLRRGKRSGEDAAAGRARLGGGPEAGLARRARRGGSRRAGVLCLKAGCRGVLGTPPPSCACLFRSFL
jgi:hypothetical protein